MFDLKLITFSVIILCLLNSCNRFEEKTSSVEIKLPLNEQEKISKSDEISNSSNQSNENSLVNEVTRSPYQKKPRRKKINFPDDCGTSVVVGTKDWLLRKTCGDTLNNILPDLPNDGCNYESVRKDGGNFFMVVDNEQMQTYRVQENINFNDLEKLAQTLNTTKDNIIINNKFGNGGKLSAGQEIKYQKSHLEKSSSAWFADYDLNFYSLQSNKYLVKVKCWASAYNVSNVYLLYDESAIPAKTKVLEFPDLDFAFNENDKQGEYPVSVKKVFVKSVPGIEFNSRTKELVTLDRRTGIGYAGHYARYSFPNGKPKLEEYRAKFKEDGNGLSDDWQRDVKKNWKRYFPK